MKKRAGVNYGIHPDCNFSHFDADESDLIYNTFGTEFYITNSGREINLGQTSNYRFILIKFPDTYRELFNIEREVVVLFSKYDKFEPRTLDAFDEVYKFYQELRIEKICSILVSKDEEIEKRISQLLSNSTESQVIVPFSYKELNEISENYFFRNRITKHFYSRDLFSFESALKKDIYFFGRNDIVHDIVNRHRNSENSGMFGLRKTGKTSIIFAIQRVLKASSEYSIYIDCQNTALYLRRWNLALKYIVDEIKRQINIKLNISDESEYTEIKCSQTFEKDMIEIRSKLKKPILIIFDETERITFDLSSEEHWKNGKDFIHFWRTMRAVFQKNNSLFTYLIVSTNPKAIETPSINGEENPLFSQIPFQYIPPFTVQQTKEMVERIANVMGLEFDEILYSQLTDDFGGHPFLIRMICSIIHKLIHESRPVKIDKIMYQNAKNKFNKEFGNYINMVIVVLMDHYKDEFDMLTFLATGDIETFNAFASISNDYTNHLLGYNIIGRNNNNYYFRIEAIKNYLIEKNKYKRINMSKDEKIAEISERRNSLEPKLRTVVRSLLHVKFGESEARKIVLDIFGGDRKSKYDRLTLKELFDPNVSSIYFDDLRKIIHRNWDAFLNVFQCDKNECDHWLTQINKYRADAHAKDIGEEEMTYFRICISKIENIINNYM